MSIRVLVKINLKTHNIIDVKIVITYHISYHKVEQRQHGCGGSTELRGESYAKLMNRFRDFHDIFMVIVEIRN